jgi:molybdenum cofactor cytidylyltransferase
MLPPVKALALEGKTARPEDVVGRILVHDLGPDLRKGTVLTDQHLDRVRQFASLHVVELEPGDVHEDVAARRLAEALAGSGIETRPPVQSQARLVSTMRGLVRVRPQLVDAINSLGYVSLFTLMDGQAVTAGEEVAGCKVTPVAVPGHLIEAAEKIAREQGPVIGLLPFRPLRTFVVATERLKPKARDLFRSAVTKKLGWYGAEVLAVREVARTSEAVAAVYREAASVGAELVLFAGASAIDPLDPAYAELASAGGELLQLGAPMHPGSMLWLARLGEAAVVGVASCAGFGRSSSLDLLLPFVFAYGRADASDLLRLGHGGLIESGAGRRFPPYS